MVEEDLNFYNEFKVLLSLIDAVDNCNELLFVDSIPLFRGLQCTVLLGYWIKSHCAFCTRRTPPIARPEALVSI